MMIRKALDNINLTFEKNKKYAIVGESGCGKEYFNKVTYEILQ